MRVFLRFLPHLVVILTLIGFELMIFVPSWLIVTGMATALVDSAGVWMLIRKKTSHGMYRRLAFPAVLLVVSALLFLIFIEHTFVRHLFAVGISVLLGVLVYNTHAFIYRPLSYQPYALENIVSYSSLFIVFLVLADSANLVLFFSVNTFLLGAVVTFFVAVTTVTAWVIGKVPVDRAFPPGVAVGLGTGALAIACRFLPAAPLVQAALAAIMWYFVTTVTREVLLGISNPRTIRRYALFSSALALVIILTARWS